MGLGSIMQRLLKYHLSFLIAFILLSLLGSQAFACLFPSPVEMREERAMACCTKSCRMKTTQKAAQQACQQSRATTGQSQLMAQSKTIMKAAQKDLANSLYGWHHLVVHNPLLTPHLVSNDLVTDSSHRLVALYLRTRSLRI